MNTVDLSGSDVYGWAHGVKRFWNTILYLVYYIVASTADYGVEIAARAIGLAAPLPNAISVFQISQDELGYSPTQALAFALVLEVSVFAFVEVALWIFDGYLRDPKKYKWPFVISVTVVAVAVTIIINFVYRIEVMGGGHTLMAWLPVISLCAFVSIGLKRWSERQREFAKMTAAKPRKNGNIAEISTPATDNLERMNAAKEEKIRKRKLEISHVISENGPLPTSEIAKLLSFDVSDKTVANDLKDMLTDGLVSKQGTKWSAVSAIPAPLEFSTNGHSER